ncbi:MAG: DUF763 domain-containing protein [archaeon]
MKTGTADLPLHYGDCPKWLFPRMVKLSRAISDVIVQEYGTSQLLKRLSNPYWFQAFGCVLGFDWHSSELTTTVCSALKEGLKDSKEIFVAGGKGRVSRKAIEEISRMGYELNLGGEKIAQLSKASRLAAKIDNNAIRDGFAIYYHSFIFDNNGNWVVIQQGMNDITSYARRYHWLSDIVDENMTSPQSEESRNASVDLVNDNPKHLERFISKGSGGGQLSINDFSNSNSFTMPKEHFPKIDFDMNAMLKAYEIQPQDYEALLLIKGLGAKTVRALALISDLVHGCKASGQDPCKYSFAHGGKDGWPEKVNKERYDESINILKDAIDNAKIGSKLKVDALRRLGRYAN